MDVSIIIVNYKTPQLVVQCIESIISKTIGCKYEIIVVDNHSEDETQRLITTRFKDVKYLYLPSNFGFGYANNRGAEISCGKYLFFLNSDTIIIDNSISVLFNYMEDNNAKVGACGGNLVDEQLKPMNSYKLLFPGLLDDIFIMTGNILLNIVYGRSKSYNYGKLPLKVARVSGADLMINRLLFERVGGFDETFFMYSEETDLMYRISKMGFITVCIPQSRIIHLEGRSCGYVEKKVKWGLISRCKFLCKHHSNLYMLVSNFLYYISCHLFLLRCFIKKNYDDVEAWKYRINNMFSINSDTPYL